LRWRTSVFGELNNGLHTGRLPAYGFRHNGMHLLENLLA
jgi:hypothetical protein